MINLTDNNRGQNPAELFGRESVAALFPLSDKPISQLCTENENLLVFPYCLEETRDDIGESYILSIKNTDNPDNVTIETGNIMGFIGIGNLKVKIKSRFDAGRDDYFLHYMLQKVMHFNLLDLKHDNDDEEVFDFIMFMFPYFLKKALRQGVYREYRRFEHNDSNVKGAISVSEHLKKNIPFSGTVAYSTKEFSYDNSMTELIRHTIEYIATKRYGKSVLTLDRETIDCVSEIETLTKAYNRSQRSNVIQQNLRQKVHPYYTEYSPLRVLCLQILRNEEVKYGSQSEEIYGILFDGAWLWEEYVGTILKHEGFKHPENKRKTGGIYLFKDNGEDGRIHVSGKRYPDFYKDGVVLDAKYKRLENYDKVSKVDRDDIHQVIAYMGALDASVGGFVAPLAERQKVVPTSHLVKAPDSTLSIFGIEVAKATTYSEFVQDMALNEKRFVQVISKM